jgi:hypothetical protein
VKELSIVSIPYDDFPDFEIFLYAQLNYHEHGWIKYSQNEFIVYMLSLDKEQAVMVRLKYLGARVDPFKTGGLPL